MERTYVQLLLKGLTRLLTRQAEELEVQDKEQLRLVIKFEKGQLGAFLFNGSKFVKQISFTELVKILIPV